MADLAVLGLQIESSQAVKAASDLDKLSTSAGKAEKAVAATSASAEQASQRIGSGSKAVERLLQAIEKVERAVREQNASMAKMGASLSNVEGRMTAATKAAQSVAASVAAAGSASAAASNQIDTLGSAASTVANGVSATAAGATRMGASLQAANQNVKLTSEQLRNLSYQGNDVITMFMSGADITQIFATQTGQVVQALQDGPGGLRGSLKAIATAVRGFITPTTLAITVLGAAAVAVRYFGDNSASNMQKAEGAAKSYEKSIRSLTTAQGDLGAVMGRVFDREMVGSVAQLERQLALLAKKQVEAKNALAENLVTAGTPSALGTINPLGPMRELFRMGTGNTSLGTLGTLGAEFEAGRRSAASLFEELTKLRINDDLPADLQVVVDKMLEGAQQAAEVEARIKAITTAIREQKREIANDNYKKATDAFSGFLPNNLTQRQQVEKAYRERVAAIRGLQDNPRSIEGRLNTAEAERLTALKEIERQEDVLRQGREIDLQAIGAQTVAERALLAAKRERLALSEPGANKEEIERKAIAAETQVYAQAEREAADALRQSTAAREQAGLEGYAAQVAAINAQYAEQIRLAQGSEAAVRALTEARDLDLQTLQVSTQKSLFQSQDDEIRRLQLEIGFIGQNDDARRKALATLQAEAELRRQGIDLNSEWGRTYVANAQQISDLDDALGKQQDAFDDLKDAASGFFEALSSGSGIMDALASTFGRLASQLASKGFDQLFGGLFGKGGSGATGVVGAISDAASKLPVYGSSMGVDKTFPAPLGAVTRAPLPPLVTGEGFSSAKASTVARQSVPAQMWNFFAGKGLAPHQIAGILGNARAESAFNPTAVGDNGQAFGLFQHNDRKQSLFNFIGGRQNLSNVNSQLEFVWKEFQTSEKKAYQRLIAARDYVEANDAMISFERPSGYQNGVKNAHNYSGRLAYTKQALETYGGGNVASSTNETRRTIEKATAAGVQKGIESTAYDRPSYDSSPRTESGGLFGTRGMAGMEVVGAGLGAFSNGYASGSPLSGGLGGIFTGLGASQSIATAFPSLAGVAGPLGMVGGAALGIIGGILGAREKRKQAHQQAAEQWAQVRPQYEAFDASLSGDRGDFRTYITDAWNQLSGFMDVGGKAWKMGKGNSTAQFDSTGRKLFEGFLKMLSEFQEGFDSMVSDMASGQGLQGAFAKGRAATKDLASQLKKTRDDIDIAFGNIASIDFLNTPAAQQQAQETERQRADAIARYNDAAAKYALSLLYTAEKVSDVQQTIDGLRGTAAGLVPIFKDLGWNADEAARVIDERLNQAIANIARGLEQNLADRIDELSGRSYLTSVRSFLEEYEGLQRDFSAAGADASRLPEFFKLQAQSIVDGAELTGDAFAELVRLFPQLNGVVSEFVEKTAEAKQAAKELAQTNLDTARDVLERSYQAETDRINDLLNARRDEANELESTISKLEDFRDQVKEFRDSLKLDDNLSTLNAQDRVDEAGRQFRELLAKARGGDEDARGRLTGAAQEYLNEAKGYYQTSTDYGDIFEEVNRALADTQATTESALSVSQSQLDALKRQITLDEQQLETNRKQYEAILGLNEGIKSLEVAFREYAAAAAAARAAGITVPGAGGGGSSSGGANYDAPRVPGINVSTESAKYLANNADVAAAIAAGQTFGLPAGMAPEVYASAHFGLHGQTEGRKWATGGLITGPGTGTSDSIPMWASNGEFMMREAAVSSVGAGTMDYINRTGRLPTIAMPASPRMVGSGNDNRGIEQRLDAMQRTLIALTTTTGGGLQRVAEAGEAGARATEQRALAERRSANNKQAA